MMFTLPIFGCLTGIKLAEQTVGVLPGVALRRTYVSTFGANMLAFAPPSEPGKPHPAPWASVRSGFAFESHIEVAISSLESFNDLTPSTAAWLTTAVLRLYVSTPIRLAVIANMPFGKEMGRSWRELEAYAFESAPHQLGSFTKELHMTTSSDLAWLHDMLPVAVRLYHDSRFLRAMSVYDQAQWSPTGETAMVLVWTGIETLFDLGGQREKTKAISKALADYVGLSRSDRDRAYQVIQQMYFKRGQIVHGAQQVDSKDVMQSFQFARVALQKVFVDGKLPSSQI